MIVLLDTDVLIDVALDRKPFVEYSSAVLDLAENHRIKGFIAWHSVANFYYLVSSASNKKLTRNFIIELLQFIEISETKTDDAIYAANRQVFGSVNLGVGPFNLRVGTNHNLRNSLNIKDNWGTFLTNSIGLTSYAGNEIFGDGSASVGWDWGSLSPVWSNEGGWMNKIWNNPTGFYSQLATPLKSEDVLHEGVHVMQSRFWGNSLWGLGWIPLYLYNHLWPAYYGISWDINKKYSVWNFNWFELQAYGGGW